MFWQLWADFGQKQTVELSRHDARNLPDPNQCYHWLWQLHFEVTTICGNLGLESCLNQIEVITIVTGGGALCPGRCYPKKLKQQNQIYVKSHVSVKICVKIPNLNPDGYLYTSELKQAQAHIKYAI